jgi:hypothetical protein
MREDVRNNTLGLESRPPERETLTDLPVLPSSSFCRICRSSQQKNLRKRKNRKQGQNPPWGDELFSQFFLKKSNAIKLSSILVISANTIN